MIRLRGARSLAEFAVNHEGAQKAFVRQFFHYMVKQPVDAYGEKALENLHRHFKKTNFNIISLTVEILCLSSMHGLKTTDQ